MKQIDYFEFGKKDAWLVPGWSCLIAPDRGLINYYESVLEQPYNRKRFRRPGVFRNIGEITDHNFRNFNDIRCLDLPIKMSGDREYRIPTEFGQFMQAIEMMISFEHAHNKNIQNYYAYLTVDQSRSINKEYHREPGLHVDGYQGARITPKVACDRSYIVADCDCPSFWNQSFETVEELDDSKVNIFHEFDRTKHYSSEIKALPMNVYMMDSYAVHSANRVTSPQRTFVRLSYSVRQFDRLGNSYNNCFDYEWEMFERNIASSLL